MRNNILNLPIGTIRSVIRIFPKAFHGYTFRIFLLATLGFLAGLFEGIGITALVPLFHFFDGDGRTSTDFISQTIEKIFTVLHIPFTLPIVLVFIVCLFIFKFIASVSYTYILARIQTGYEKMAMDKLLKSTLQADWPYLLTQRLGKLETLIKIDSRHSGGMLQAVSTFLMICATLFAYLILSVNISETVTAVAFVFGGIVLLLYKPMFSFARRLSKKISQANVIIAQHINESLVGLKTIKAMVAEEKIMSRGSHFFQQLRASQLRLTTLTKITTESMQPLGVLFLTIIIAFAFYQTSYNLGVLAALVYLIHRIFQYTQSVQSIVQNISTELPYVENMVSYLEEAELAKENRYSQGEQPFTFTGSLALKSVSFSYTDRQEVLHSNSFTVKKGEMVGFIGPSGAGKTTIFDLLLRFLRPTKGKILIDERDVDTISISDWRKNISYVSQDIFLLNDTVFNNIKFFDSSVTKEDVYKAAKLAQIYDFIGTMPDKFDTVVGERGVLLSAGQRQRVALARALARKPKILLLDEATSALDNESEQKIQTAIEDLKGDMTILVIAHRLSTVLNSDKLCVVEEGRIVEEGSPRALLKDNGTYFHKVYNLRK